MSERRTSGAAATIIEGTMQQQARFAAITAEVPVVQPRREATTVWADIRDVETRHTRLIDSGTTLCGLGSEHTRNFSRHVHRDSRCATCQQTLDRLNAQQYFY